MKALMCVLAVVALASAVLVAGDAAASSSSPFVVVEKSVSQFHVVVGSEFETTITATNIGDAAAFDLSFSDVSIDGSVKTYKKDKVEAGETASFTYTTIGDTLGDYASSPATVSFAKQQGGEQSSTSTSTNIREELEAATKNNVAVVEVLTQSQYERKNSNHVKEWIIFLLIAVVPIGFPYFVYRTKSQKIEQLLREQRKKRNH